MNNVLRIFIALLWLAATASAQITVSESTPPYKPIVAKSAYPADELTDLIASWTADEKTSYEKRGEELFIWAEPGDHWLKLTLVVQRFENLVVLVPDPMDPLNPAKAKPQSIKVVKSTEVKNFHQVFTVIGARPPPPVPPTPPIPVPPIPDPIPPQPTPGKISVLIIEDATARPKLPPSQLNAIFSEAVRQYLNSHCLIGPDGKTPEWRHWHKDADVTSESAKWQGAMAQFKAIQPMPKLPYLMISNGVTGTAGPLPENEAALLELLRKWGGP